MSEPTTTRAVLRKSLCRQLGMPFFKFYNSALASAAGSDSTEISCSDLTQPEHYWEGSWLYGADTTEDVRQVVAFLADSNIITPDRHLTYSPTAGGLSFELHTGWNAYTLHDAISRAIDSSFPHFFQVTSETSMIVQEDKLEYDLTVGTNTTYGGDGYVTYSPYMMLVVEFERPDNKQTGICGTAGAATTIYCTNADLTDVVTYPTNYLVSIYDGTGRGQYRRVVSANNTTKLVTISTGTTNWGTNPDTTSKFALWSPTDETYAWKRTFAVRFDKKDWPTKLWLPSSISSLYGIRMRIRYVHKPAALTSEADTTVVPPEFVIPKALSYLYDERMTNNKFDRQRYDSESTKYKEAASEYAQFYGWQMPHGTPWMDHDIRNLSGYIADPAGDPMNWRRS